MKNSILWGIQNNVAFQVAWNLVENNVKPTNDNIVEYAKDYAEDSWSILDKAQRLEVKRELGEYYYPKGLNGLKQYCSASTDDNEVVMEYYNDLKNSD